MSTSGSRPDEALLLSFPAKVVRGSIQTVGTRVVAIVATALSERRRLILEADRDNGYDIYVGWTETVTANAASSGGSLRLAPGDAIPLDLGPEVAAYAISTNASQILRVTELA
jgi:hypothetical protein